MGPRVVRPRRSTPFFQNRACELERPLRMPGAPCRAGWDARPWKCPRASRSTGHGGGAPSGMDSYLPTGPPPERASGRCCEAPSAAAHLSFCSASVQSSSKVTETRDHHLAW
eukprot:6476193-Pyramimonas_sp.AAC.1